MEKRENEFKEYCIKVENVVEKYQYYISVYRDANLSIRKSAVTPPCFKNRPLALEVPPVFESRTLNWICKEEKRGNAELKKKNENIKPVETK
ncbi:MAG: hypothetical protein U5Q03_17530 [Bacteroidota bacterium]|nr:hypothetical protein [Bacteroidota bacterium]